MISRRSFLGGASAAAAMVVCSHHSLNAEPLGLPLGLQLYSVRQQLAKDYDATLLEVGGVGYREVEAAGFYQHSAADVKQAMAKAKLRCVSSHHPFADLRLRFDELLAFNKELGVDYMICSSPGFRVASDNDPAKTLSIEDWRWNAEQFNTMGAKAAAAGLHFGYHNHVKEFAPIEGTIPYVELLRLTDPVKVTLELDCGWAIVAGAKPVDLLRDHAGRFSMLHVKDFEVANSPGTVPAVTELGLGSIDYRPIFEQAARTQSIKHAFVEQEAFDMPYMKSLKVDAAYMRALKV